MTKDEVFGSNQPNSSVRPSEVTAESGSKFIGAVFLYLTLALFVTFAVVGGMGALFKFAIYNNSLADFETFIYIFIFALILYIPVMIWVHIAARRNGKTVGVAFFVYSILMGVLISPVCVLFDFWTVVIALGTTVLAFAVMALIAWTSKKNMGKLAVIAFGLLIGALLLSLFNFIFYLVAPGIYNILYLVVSAIFFIAIILITIFDLKNVQQIAMNGNATKNIAFVCALNLYVDFIYIFIRILYLIAMLLGNKR